MLWCARSGAPRADNTYDMSTAVRSEFEETTVTFSLPQKRTFDATHEKSTGVPAEVLIPPGFFTSEETDAPSATTDAPLKRRRTE